MFARIELRWQIWPTSIPCALGVELIWAVVSSMYGIFDRAFESCILYMQRTAPVSTDVLLPTNAAKLWLNDAECQLLWHLATYLRITLLIVLWFQHSVCGCFLFVILFIYNSCVIVYHIYIYTLHIYIYMMCLYNFLYNRFTIILISYKHHL